MSDTSELSISLAYDDGTGDTDLGLPTMAFSTEGGGDPDILSLGTFSQTQAAQSANIKVDGYPSTATPEEQRLTLGSVAAGGHFHLTYKGQTTGEILYDASTDEIQDALELLSNVNLNDITVGGNPLNQAGYTSFTFLSSAGDTEMISIDATALTPSGAKTATIAEYAKGSNGYIERGTNSITDALSGITLNLHDITETGKPIKITISKNTASVTQKIQAMVTAYNALITELKAKTEYDTETKKMGILSNDMGASLMKSQSRTPFVGAAAGFIDTIDSFIQASDIGITIDGAGMMKFDTSIFNDAVNEDFNGVLDLLGATKSSNSENGVIQFYNASDKYTTAATYNVAVDINGSHQITGVRIKLSTEPESAFRDNSTWLNNLVTGISTFDDEGNPVYPENGLQFTVDLTQAADTYTATISVKQGIAGAFEDFLDNVLETDGRFDISQAILDDKTTAIEKKIENEQTRLDKVKQRLVDKYARLEKTLTLIQQQLAAVNQITSSTFSN
ncbi:MAG: flagellar filament capping protein FliD, partial [Phycisphaerae bacterium]|nr:flagellar filament capping protein FliD [Phycisphaerae bacterium]